MDQPAAHHAAPSLATAEDVQPPLVGIVMGSASDWNVMQQAAIQLANMGVP